MINIYCDESCHLQNDSSDIMVLGGISCNDEEKKKIFNDIRLIKVKHNLSSWFEIKWTKISYKKIEFYKELIDYFFKNNLKFRGIIATDKKNLNHVKYNNGDYNEWYYKMYYLLLDYMITPSNEYRIFIDIKDTKGGPKVKKLHEVIRDIKQINSKESEILQITDLFIGALGFKNRKIKNLNAKSEIVEYIESKYQIKMNKKTSRNEEKFNIFIWEPRK